MGVRETQSKTPRERERYQEWKKRETEKERLSEEIYEILCLRRKLVLKE